MAQTKKKRSRKHRGTPAGNVERTAHNSRTKSPKTDAKKIQRERRPNRLDSPPTWKGSINRAAMMAVFFGILVVLFLKRPPAAGALLAVVMFALYIPLGYYTDRAVYNFRQRKKKQQRS